MKILLALAVVIIAVWYRSLVRHWREGPVVVVLREWEPWRDPRLDDLADRIEPARLGGSGRWQN